MSRTPAPLKEPVEIAKWWKSRRRDIALVVTLRHYEGHNLVDVREHYTDQAGLHEAFDARLGDGCAAPPRIFKGPALCARESPVSRPLPDDGEARP